MAITIKQVEHMAELAKLELSEAEKKKRAEEFSQILGYIEKLNEVDVSKVESMTQPAPKGLSLNVKRQTAGAAGGSELINKVREDQVTRPDGKGVRDKFVKLAPEHTEEYIETISPLGVTRYKVRL